MDSLQKALDEQLTKLPHQVLHELLDKKLKTIGIKLPKKRTSELAERILLNDLEALNFIEDQKNTRKQGQKLSFTDEDLRFVEGRINNVLKALPLIVQAASDKASSKILKDLKQKWPIEAEQQTEETFDFRKRLNKRWGKGLEKLQLLLTVAREVSYNFSLVPSNSLESTNKKTSKIILRLHARSCQLTDEIICLLQNGFADGAVARWRTLHEISAVCFLIKEHGDDLAERYELHQDVESYKAANQYQKHQERLGEDPIPSSTLAKLKKKYDAAIERYGHDFGNSYGWAANHIGKRNPNIADIQEAAGIDYLAPYYRMASHNVHANPKGAFFKLGLIGETNVLLAGRSNAGLADPGQLTTISLIQISSVLIQFHKTLDNIAAAKVMQKLGTEISRELITAHKKLKSAEIKREQLLTKKKKPTKTKTKLL